MGHGKKVGFGIVLAAAVAVGMAACSSTSGSYTIERKTVNGLPTVTATESAKAQAKVELVDYANRSIALTGPNGKTEIFVVAPEVRNFSQIKKGDTVSVEYASRIIATVRKTDEPLTTSLATQTERAKLGDKPGIVCTRQAVVEARVESIDYATRIMKLKTTTGDTLTIVADKKLKDLERVQKGDQVVFDYIEAVSIAVD